MSDSTGQTVQFTDFLPFNADTKRAISVRDGVQEYLGIEIGEEPADKVFTIYRSPATIANAAQAMKNIPLTDEHVDLRELVQNPVGRVKESRMIDLVEDSTNTRLAVENQIELSDSIMGALQTGKRELSLGYLSRLVPHDVYDYEQLDIEPHHLAVVSRGRCGAACSFIDKEGVKMDLNKAFCDAEGNPSLEQIVSIAMELPEAIKKLDMEQLGKVMPVLQEIVQSAEGGNSDESGDGEDTMEDEQNEEKDPPEENGEDPHAADLARKDGEDEKEEYKDADKVAVTDTQEFKDAVQQALTRHTEVIEKAKDFVDESYRFKDKSTCQIMRDALAVEYGKQSFSDAELPVAFKLLKKSSSALTSFGDHNPNKFESLKNKEL